MLGYFIKLITFMFMCFSAFGKAEIYVIRYESQFFFQQYQDMPATFGPQLSSDRVVRGMLLNANPLDACTPIDKAPNETDLGKWIVLIARYTERKNCSFEQKVRTAQNANFSAAIIYNINSEQLIPMSAKNSTGINIPSVFVGENTGKNLIEITNPDYYIVITGDSSSLPILLMVFSIVVGMCLVIIVTFMIVKFIKDRRRQRRHRLPTSTLNKIPTCKFQKGDPYETCAICLDDYIEGEKLRVLPCNHAYHVKCIDPWLTKNRRVCPICKRKVFAHDEPQPDTDSDSDTSPDDTTPLINNRSTPTIPTFQPNLNNLQRAARSISQQLNSTNFNVTASGHHSINGEYHPTSNPFTSCSSSSSSSTPSSSSSSSSTCGSDDICDNNLDVVHVHTHPQNNSGGGGGGGGSVRV